jgi:hypothetical protein
MKYKIKVEGLQTSDGSISIRAFKLLVDSLLETAERALRLAVQGESIKRGPLPNWLARSLDFTVTGLKKGSTTILLDAPELGDTAPQQIIQQDLWYSKPTPADTALSLVSRSVKDAVSEDVESLAYDKGVLEGLLFFESFFKSFGNKLLVQSSARPTENFELSGKTLERVGELRAEIPEPIATVISGQFDVIQHSRKKFYLALGNNEVIPGTIDPEILNVEQMREFWGKKVTIKGIVHFKPGRGVRLFEAQTIKLIEAGEDVFDRSPVSPKAGLLFDSEIQKLSVAPALKEIWGEWPGDESIDELLAALTP